MDIWGLVSWLGWQFVFFTGKCVNVGFTYNCKQWAFQEVISLWVLNGLQLWQLLHLFPPWDDSFGSLGECLKQVWSAVIWVTFLGMSSIFFSPSSHWEPDTTIFSLGTIVAWISHDSSCLSCEVFLFGEDEEGHCSCPLCPTGRADPKKMDMGWRPRDFSGNSCFRFLLTALPYPDRLLVSEATLYSESLHIFTC